MVMFTVNKLRLQTDASIEVEIKRNINSIELQFEFNENTSAELQSPSVVNNVQVNY